MIKNKKKNNIINFPSKLSQVEKEIEAIIFSAAEPLNIETIQNKLSKRTDVEKIMIKLQKEYNERGINLVCISKKWSFRTSQDLVDDLTIHRGGNRYEIFYVFFGSNTMGHSADRYISLGHGLRVGRMLCCWF